MQGSRLLRSLFVVGPAVAGLTFTGVGVPGVGGADTRPPPPAAPGKAKADLMGKLPISFEANQGQTDSRVKFMSRSANGTLFVTPDEAVLSLPAQAAMSAKADTKAPATDNAVLRMKVLGGNPDAQVSGAKELPGKINYLNADPAKTHTNVPTFARTETKAVYPGIDMAWYGKGSSMEYDFIVAPGANPSTIQLGFTGAKGLRLDKGGDLVMNVGGQEVRQHKPVLYQETAGKKSTVPGRFVLGQNNEVGFSVGSYDQAKALVIDPVLVWSTYLGAEASTPFHLELDSADNVYVSGTIRSAVFPFTNAYDSTRAAFNRDAFVAKFTPNGSALVYATYLGSDLADTRNKDMAVDGAGSVVVAVQAINFPTTPGAYSAPAPNSFVPIIVKLHPDGSGVAYATTFASPRRTTIRALDVDGAGAIYVGGALSGDTVASLTGTPGAFQEQCFDPGTGSCDTEDAFVAKLNPAGNGAADLEYLTYLGGVGQEETSSIEVDNASGVVYLAGQTKEIGAPRFPTTAGAYAHDVPGDPGFDNVWVAKLSLDPDDPTPAVLGDGDSDDLLYSTVMGGAYIDDNPKVAKGPDGSIYVAGNTGSPAAGEVGFPVTPGAFQRESIKQYEHVADIFMARINPDPDDPNTGAGDPDDLLYSTLLGSAFSDGASGLAVDGNGWAYVGGLTTASTYPVTPNRLQKKCGCFFDFGEFSPADAVISVINPDPDDPPGDGRDTDDLLFSTWLGGTGEERVADLELDSRNRIVVTGPGGSIPTTRKAFNRTGSNSTWVAKIDAAIE